MRLVSFFAASVSAIMSFSVLAASPSAAATGSLAVSNGVFWDEDAVEHPYSWTYMPDFDHQYKVSMSVQVTGPDGLPAGSSTIADVPYSATRTITLLGEQMDGTYTLSATITGCDSNFDCRDTVLTPQTFQMRLPQSKTILRTRKTDVEPGNTVKLRAKVFEQRPSAFFVTDNAQIWLERRKDGKWKQVSGSKEGVTDGTYGWSVKYTGGRDSYRAVTAKGDGHDTSTSQVVTLR